MLTKGQSMHIHRTYQVSVSLETALFAVPLPVSRLMLMSTCRTLARCSSFGASEARHVGLFAFVGQIVNILPVLPQAHALIVMGPMIVIAHPMRIADKERTHLMLYTEVDDLAGCLMPLIADTPFSASTLLVFSAVELLPPSRVFLATGLLFGKLA